MTDLRDAITRALEETALEEVLGLLEQFASELVARDIALSQREEEVENLLLELNGRKDDEEAVNPSQERYKVPDTYVNAQGVEYLDPEGLPHRERHVLATVQSLAQGQGELLISNKELLQHLRSKFDPVTRSGLTACLTRLTHKGLISTRNMNGQGYPRIIVIEQRLEDPTAHTGDFNE